MSSHQSGGNFKSSKHQRSKPKKLETPKQDGGRFFDNPFGIKEKLGAGNKSKKQKGGWLDWLVPPLAIARLARQKKARRRRAQMRQKQQMRMSQERMSQGRNDRYRYAKPRTSRNFYINVSNNSSRNNSKQQNNSQQLKPATNPNRPWVDRRQKG